MSKQKAEIKRAQVVEAVALLGTIPHVVNSNNTIAIPSPVGTIMFYPTTYKIQYGSTVRSLEFPVTNSGIKSFIDEMICLYH